MRQLHALLNADCPPGALLLEAELALGINILETEAPAIRPFDANGQPGGLVVLNHNIPTLIIPDLHGRRKFLFDVLRLPLYRGDSFLKLLGEARANVVCVGDAFHGESPVRERWDAAYQEYLRDYTSTEAMDKEMTDNLCLLQMVLHLKIQYPEHFFFLKGNHENIANENGYGNFAFRKFVREGEMVRLWTERFMGRACFELLYRYEKLLPLAVKGDGFLITHAEPERAFTAYEIVNAYANEEVIYGLTWTGNGDAVPGSVSRTLDNIFPDRQGTLCFGGHRPVRGLFALRNGDRYVQINHPVEQIAAVVERGEDFIPEEHILQISKMSERDDWHE